MDPTLGAAAVGGGANLLSKLFETWAAQKQKNQELEQQAELAKAQTMQNLGQQQAGTFQELMQAYGRML